MNIQRAMNRIIFLFALLSCTTAFGQLEAEWTLEEGTGTSSADSSGNGRHLTFTGAGATWNTTNFAPVPTGSTASVQFSANDHYLVATGYGGVGGTADRSVSSWINMNGTTDLNQAIVSWGDNVAGERFTFRTQDSNGIDGAIRTEVSGGYIVGNTNVFDGDWHHVTTAWANDGTPDVADVKLYVDGRRQLISAVSGQSMNTDTSLDVQIGSDSSAITSPRSFQALLDQTSIHSSSLSARDVRILATGSPLPIATINYDAAVDATGADTQNVFDAQLGDADLFDLQTPGALMTNTPSPGELNVTQYWNYDGSQSSPLFEGANDFNNVPGDATTQNGSLLLTVRRGDQSAQQVLFETGGAGDGSSITLDGDTLQFTAKNSGFDGLASVDLMNVGVDEFMQILAVFDLENDSLDLYVDGVLANSGTFNGADWGGTDDGALAGADNVIGGDTGALALAAYGNFIGDIADFSYFSEALDATDAANLFQASQLQAVPEPATIAVWTLIGAGLCSGMFLRRRKERSVKTP